MVNIIEFFDTIFNTLQEDEMVFCTTFPKHPAGGDGWPCNSSPKTLSRNVRPVAAYFCTSSVVRQGRPRRSAGNLQRLHVLVLDDVGEKAPENGLLPTYKIETSLGSFHWGYRLTTPPEGEDAEALVRAVYTGRGLTDEGGKMTAKMVRAPVGFNFKPGKGRFPVTLTEWNPEVSYTTEELVEAWGLSLEPVSRRAHVHQPAGRRTSAPATGEVEDPLLTWLRKEGYVTADHGGEWVDVSCPWGADHSPGGDDSAGYKPLGRGERENSRGFKCFHEHCKDRRTFDFLAWSLEQGAPRAEAYDGVTLLLQRYALVAEGQRVVDLTADAGAAYPSQSWADWSFKHQYVGLWKGSKKPRPVMADKAWKMDSATRRYTAMTYVPGSGAEVETRQGVFLNTYRPPWHPEADGAPDWFLDHLRHVVRDPWQAEQFLDWLAFKIQNPARRSYAVIMVADFDEEESGTERFGIGRSLIGRAIRGVLQNGVAAVDLEDVVGDGGSSSWTDWQADTQLVVVEEAREQVQSWRDDNHHYEKLKGVIDTSIVEGKRVNTKYGAIRAVDLYFNMLMFSNHANAISLPAGDRRFMVLGNRTERRTEEEYAAVVEALADKEQVARLFWFLKEREVTHGMVFPPMTPEKARMQRLAKTGLDSAWDCALDHLEGDLVTQEHLKGAMREAIEQDLEIDHLLTPGMDFARRKYLGLDYLIPGDKDARVSLLGGDKVGQRVRCKVLRNRARWQETYEKHTGDKFLRATLTKNERKYGTKMRATLPRKKR